MKHHTLLTLLCLLSPTAALPFTISSSYSPGIQSLARTTGTIAVTAQTIAGLSELSYEQRLIERDKRIARLQVSLESAEELCADGDIVSEAKRQITEYQEEREQLVTLLQRSAKLIAALGAIQGIASVGNNKIEKTLEAVERASLSQPLPRELWGIRRTERKYWILLDNVLLLLRNMLMRHGVHGTPIERISRGQFMWLTAVQRFVHVVHTWRRWQGASNMTKMVKFSLLIQLVNLGMTFFLPYRDLATDEWPEGVLSQLDNEILKDAQASMQFAGRSIDDDDICPTCRESFFGNGPVVYRAGCGDPPGSARHYVHRECEEVWQRARRDSVCVLCRSTDRTLIDAPTSPPYFSSEHATRRDRRFAEINEHSQNNVVIRNFMPAYLYGWVTSPSPLARRLADLSVGTTGDPIPPGGPRATAPVRSVSVENAGNPALPPVAVPLS